MNGTEFKIDGVIMVPNGITQEEIENAFIDFVESKGWTFGGGIGPVKDEE